MNTRAELEATLEKAEAEWHRASDELDDARAEEARAHACWDKVVADRRMADTDRRNPGAVWDNRFPDRRKPDSDRRDPRAELRALSKAVADRHRAYADLVDAEDRLARAELRRNSASAERNRVIVALAELDAATGKR